MNDQKIPLNLYKISSPLTGIVLKNIKLTADSSPNDTRHVVMDLSKSSYSYLEGQSAGILPPGKDARGKPHAVRLYSIASKRGGDLGGGQTLSLCVARHFWEDQKTGAISIPGLISNYLSELQIGETIRITGPVGRHFVLPKKL